LIFSSQYSQITSTTRLPTLDLSSDHSLVILTLNDETITTKTHPTLTPGQTNWQTFSKIIENKIMLNIPLKTTIDIDNAVQSLSTVIQNAVLDSSLSTSIFQKSNLQLPHHISQHLAEKRRARSRWQRYHLQNDKKMYYNLACSLKNSPKIQYRKISTLSKNYKQFNQLTLERNKKQQNQKSKYPFYATQTTSWLY